MEESRNGEAARAARRRRASARLVRTHAEAHAADRAFWRQLTPEERVLETWRLSEELWRLRGEFNDEPGLCRSVARLYRGGLEIRRS